MRRRPIWLLAFLTLGLAHPLWAAEKSAEPSHIPLENLKITPARPGSDTSLDAKDRLVIREQASALAETLFDPAAKNICPSDDGVANAGNAKPGALLYLPF
jgi:hypothetical protein